MKIGFLGGGKIAQAMAKGFIKVGMHIIMMILLYLKYDKFSIIVIN